ncbi:MAG: hypothetical protein HZA34_02630 [Candidatus Pacebacteria bacterium]|nr:hypothetical protein [Candidatus Paceibacterota bacterium]
MKKPKHLFFKHPFQEIEHQRFWKQFFQIEQLADTELKEHEAYVLTARNTHTGEEKRYEGIRLKKTIRRADH